MTRMIHRIRKGIGLLLSVVTITTGLMAALTSTVYAEADEGGRVPYQFAFDNILSLHFSDTRIRVLRNLQLDLGAPLEAAGWVATPDGITGYQYLWLPVGDALREKYPAFDKRAQPLLCCLRFLSDFHAQSADRT